MGVVLKQSIVKYSGVPHLFLLFFMWLVAAISDVINLAPNLHQLVKSSR